MENCTESYRKASTVPDKLRDLVIVWTIAAVGLSGCSFTLPVAVTDIQSREEVTKAEQEPPAQFDLRLHPDGLGWQVRVNQKTSTVVSVRGKERWKYRLYDFSRKRQMPDPSNYDDLCAIGMLATPLLAPLDVGRPPYWTRWDRLIPACSRRADAQGSVYESHERHFRTHRQLQLTPVTEGHVSLAWNTDGHDPTEILIPLTHNSLEHGVDVRLRWLAELLRRKGTRLVHDSHEPVELRLVQNNQIIIRQLLAVTAEDMDQALNDSRIVQSPPGQWPAPLVVRIARNHDVLTESEHAQLLTRATLLLHRLAVPVVLRGPELHDLREMQAKVHLPNYADELRIDAGHLVGATILLHMDVQQPYSQGRALTVDLIKIETGEILATIMSEGHISQWPYVVDTTILHLDSVFQRVLLHYSTVKVGARLLLNE